MSVRLDTYLFLHGLSRSREQARKEIITGWVKVNGETVRKPSVQVKPGSVISIDRPGGLFVSRGGEKLHHALTCYNIDVNGRTALDCGASTGGFTDCLLKQGARKVYAVDVGYGQLDYSLRSDARVVVIERTHVKNLTAAHFSESIDFICADLSFISLTRVYKQLAELFLSVEAVFLVKPQFEAQSGELKKGVVRRPECHTAILTRVITDLAGMGMLFRGLCASPLRGPAGNIEFLLHCTVFHKDIADTEGISSIPEGYIEGIVASAHITVA